VLREYAQHFNTHRPAPITRSAPTRGQHPTTLRRDRPAAPARSTRRPRIRAGCMRWPRSRHPHGGHVLGRAADGPVRPRPARRRRPSRAARRRRAHAWSGSSGRRTRPRRWWTRPRCPRSSTRAP
jgi:hypothetical protein